MYGTHKKKTKSIVTEINNSLHSEEHKKAAFTCLLYRIDNIPLE
jgi:hypothetical protein